MNAKQLMQENFPPFLPGDALYALRDNGTIMIKENGIKAIALTAGLEWVIVDTTNNNQFIIPNSDDSCYTSFDVALKIRENRTYTCAIFYPTDKGNFLAHNTYYSFVKKLYIKGSFAKEALSFSDTIVRSLSKDLPANSIFCINNCNFENTFCVLPDKTLHLEYLSSLNFIAKEELKVAFESI